MEADFSYGSIEQRSLSDLPRWTPKAMRLTMAGRDISPIGRIADGGVIPMGIGDQQDFRSSVPLDSIIVRRDGTVSVKQPSIGGIGVEC